MSSLNSYHYRILELLQKDVYKHWNMLHVSAMNDGIWYDNQERFYSHTQDLVNLKYIELDSRGNYFITDKGEALLNPSYLSEANRNLVIKSIKDKVKYQHSASVIDVLKEFRANQQSIDENFELRINSTLIESISVQLIASLKYSRTKSEKDYIISLKSKDKTSKDWIKDHLIYIIITVLATLIATYIAFKMGWI